MLLILRKTVSFGTTMTDLSYSSLYQDGWISTTPLAARVEAGEALQAEILARVEAGEAKQATIESGAMMKGGAQTLTDDNWSIKDDGGNTYAMISDGEITMYHVAYPEAPKQPASKEYADTKIAKKGDTMQGSLAMAGHQITGLGTPKQRGHTVSKGYMDDVIEPILDRLNQFAGSIGDFVYTYDGEQSNAREGKFNAKTQGYELTDLVNETEYIEFNMTDSEGKNPDFARLLDGDILRITGPAGERAEWYVRAGSDGSNGVLLLGDLIRATFDEFVAGVQYAVTGITVAEPNSATLILTQATSSCLDLAWLGLVILLAARANSSGFRWAAVDLPAIHRCLLASVLTSKNTLIFTTI